MFKMKKILVLVIFFINLTFIWVRSTSEIMSSYPTTVSMQRQKSGNFISLHGAGKSEKIQRIVHSIGSIDSNCIKNLHNQFRYNNRSRYRRPFGMVRPLRVPAFRSDGSNQHEQIPYFHKARQNHLKEPQIRRPFGNDRIIFLPPYVKLNEKRANTTQIANEYKMNKTSQSDSREDLANKDPKKIANETVQEISVNEKFKGKDENTKNVETFTSSGKSRKNEGPYSVENSTLLVEIHNVPKTNDSDEKPSEIPYKLHELKSTTATYSGTSPHHFWPKRPTLIQPYEVEEVVEEELGVDSHNEKSDNLKNNPFDGPIHSGKEVIKQKLTGSENGQKINGFHDIMGSSINSVLKSLMSPILKVFPTVESNPETFPKEKVQNHPIHNIYFTTTSPSFATFSNRRFSDFRKITNNRLLPNRQEQSKNLKIANPQNSGRIQYWTQKTTDSTSESEKITSELNYDNKLNFVSSTLKVGYQGSQNARTIDQTEILYTPLRVLKTDDNTLNLKENLQQKTTAMTEMGISSSSGSSENLTNLGSLTTLETQKTSSTVEQTLRKKSENPPNPPFFTSSKNQTALSKISLSGEEFTTVKTTSIDSLSGFIANSTEESETFSEVQNVKTEYEEPYFSATFSEMSTYERQQTAPDFQELTDSPKTFDLLTTIKSDLKKNQNGIGKNSRKMHFGREHLKATTSNPIAGLGSTGLRRSDILITESFDDYVDINNNLPTLNYLEKLKQINSFPPQNLSLKSTFIPLIPKIIHDLRENKISLEDVSILSEAFGSYWPSITGLANATNLDMLPLLKMKNEEDWKNILQNFLPENTEATTVEAEDTHPKKGDDYSPYDYLDEYKDFYEYVFEPEEQEKEKRRKKPRPKRDEDDLKKVEESREYLENTEEEQNPSNGNMLEGTFYIETSEEDEDASGFDMKFKMANLNVNLHNVTSQTRINIF